MHTRPQERIPHTASRDPGARFHGYIYPNNKEASYQASPQYQSLSGLIALVMTLTPTRARAVFFLSHFVLQSHRTMSRYSGVSSTGMMFFYLATSVGFAASAIPFWDTWAVTGTSFYAMGLTSVRSTGYTCRGCTVVFNQDLYLIFGQVRGFV